MNQPRQSVIVKHVSQDQRYDDLRQFYDSCTDSDGSFEDLISQDAEFDVVQSDDENENDGEMDQGSRNVKRKKWRETKVERDWEFLTKQWFYEAAKQDVLQKEFTSVRACAKYYGLNHGSLNKYIKTDTCFQQRGSTSKVRS